jgi:dipeptidyl aminopeptidase/acylaminoacyl peptidase
MGGPPWENPEEDEWKKWDPAQHIGNWEIPSLIIHGELDKHHPVSEGLAAFHCLRSRGIDSTLLTFPDESDQVRKPENLVLWYRTLLSWMKWHVKQVS